jgi:hypothetical protein
LDRCLRSVCLGYSPPLHLALGRGPREDHPRERKAAPRGLFLCALREAVLRLGRFSHEPAGLGDLRSDRIGIVCESDGRGVVLTRLRGIRNSVSPMHIDLGKTGRMWWLPRGNTKHRESHGVGRRRDWDPRERLAVARPELTFLKRQSLTLGFSFGLSHSSKVQERRRRTAAGCLAVESKSIGTQRRRRLTG